jgi:hypothetical protein
MEEEVFPMFLGCALLWSKEMPNLFKDGTILNLLLDYTGISFAVSITEPLYMKVLSCKYHI